nr:Chain A, GLY-CYS-HIS-TYR-THR-PRO-PHE-GLY-LEU-ILE-CYS-PHE peptide [Heliofungia actiniformis]
GCHYTPFGLICF